MYAGPLAVQLRCGDVDWPVSLCRKGKVCFCCFCGYAELKKFATPGCGRIGPGVNTELRNEAGKVGGLPGEDAKSKNSPKPGVLSQMGKYSRPNKTRLRERAVLKGMQTHFTGKFLF